MAPKLSCPECGDNFTNTGNLVRHRVGHDPNSFTPCQNCDFISTRTDSMKRHIARKHPMNRDIAEPDAFKNIQQTISNAIVQPHDIPQSDKFDKRLQLPHNFIYAGASQSVSLVITDHNMIYMIHFQGKTHLLMKTLENASTIYNPVPTRVYFIYSCK